MSKSIKFKNNTYLDTSGIVHEKTILKDLINYNSKTQNGYTKLLNGLILQWGTTTISGITSNEQKVEISFNINFSTKCFNVQTSMSDVGYGIQKFTSAVGIPTITTSGFTANIKSTSDRYSSSGFVLYWFAIGY